MIKKQIRYLQLSDNHLGHSRVDTQFLCQNLKKTIQPFKHKRLDAIFFCGDLFDKLLNVPSIEYHHAQHFLHWLLCFCEDEGLVLRILEGTPSHDWGQSKVIESIKTITDKNVDCRWIPSLHIEYIEKLDIHVLYVPDEWDPDANKTLAQVKAMMTEMHISQVDLAMMHGQFSYQIPVAKGHILKHDEAEYLALTKYLIHIGHVHTHSVYSRIIASGSTDRLAHNEEESKGLIYAEINQDGTYEWSFIENKGAKIFKTIQVRGETLTDVMAYLDRRLTEYPKGSFIRLKAKRDHFVWNHFTELKIRYADYILGDKKDDKEEQYIPVLDVEIEHDSDYKQFSITEENIYGLMKTSLEKTCNFGAQHWTLFDEFMNKNGCHSL